MTTEELLTLLAAMSDDQKSKIMDTLKSKEPPKPSEPPKPAEPPKPNEPVKADSMIQMTAAEFMQMMSKFTAGGEDKKPKKEDDDDGELYL